MHFSESNVFLYVNGAGVILYSGLSVRLWVSEFVRPENLANVISKSNEGNLTHFWSQMYFGSWICWLAFVLKGQRSRSQQAEA